MDALELVTSRGGEINLVLSDMVMPGREDRAGGPDVAIAPKLPVLLMLQKVSAAMNGR